MKIHLIISINIDWLTILDHSRKCSKGTVKNNVTPNGIFPHDSPEFIYINLLQIRKCYLPTFSEFHIIFGLPLCFSGMFSFK